MWVGRRPRASPDKRSVSFAAASLSERRAWGLKRAILEFAYIRDTLFLMKTVSRIAIDINHRLTFGGSNGRWRAR